jgi:hypothetical protein
MPESYELDPANNAAPAATRGEPESTLIDEIIEHTEAQTVARERAMFTAKIDASHKYPRRLKAFLDDATAAATMSQEIAKACTYSIPRDGKQLVGPSVRLAEICAACWGNIEAGARIIDAYADDGKRVIVEGFAYDTEKNVGFTAQVSRNTSTKKGGVYGEDMRGVTIQAASSIAMRNAVLRVIPKVYVEMIRQEAIKVAAGKGKPLAEARKEIIERFAAGATKAGFAIKPLDVARLVGKPEIEAMDWDDVGTIIGFGTAMKDGDTTWAEILAPLTGGKAPIQQPKPTSETATATTTAPDDGNPAQAAILKALPSLREKGKAAGFATDGELAGFLSQHVGEDGDGAITIDMDKAQGELELLAKATKKK